MNYPDWVKKFRTKGTAIKKVGNQYYLYKHTSKRVPGKKYPQAVDTYIGLITPNGVVKKSKKKVSLEDIEVYEYGFSKSLFELCPIQWKNTLKSNWEMVLLHIIAQYSENSYYLKDRSLTAVSHNIDVQRKRLEKEIGIMMEDLLSLKSIYMICLKDRNVISKINESQKIILEKYKIDLGGDQG